MTRSLLFPVLFLVSSPAVRGEEAPASVDAAFRARVEMDWLLQERYRRQSPGPVTAAEDAAGGCDGLKDGTYGFHTGSGEAPWWMVDLGEPRRLGRAVIWNRGDGAAERAFGLSVRLSADGTSWETVHEGKGEPFGGVAGGKPLEVDLGGRTARLLRIVLPGSSYLHLDEVEVFSTDEPASNVALGRPAGQSSVSQWSRRHGREAGIDLRPRTAELLALARQVCAERREAGIDPGPAPDELDRIEARLACVPPAAPADAALPLYLEVRWALRRLLFADPLLDFDSILFAKRVPGSFNHMSDQYLGWWSRPGGGIHVLRGFRDGPPAVSCLTDGTFREPGSFLDPALSPDGRRVLFSWCRYYPGLAGEGNKLDKGNVPEDAFYHVFEMAADGSGLRRLTRGKYDDFDARYLPGGRIVFLSTRRGQSIRAGRESAAETLLRPDLPDIYVRCGGGPERPCAVYTLHTMDADGGDLRAISPFEMFEWTPSVARDGTILHSRWDYIDRDNMPYMGLWSIRPDGSSPRLVYKNFTKAPHCVFEAQQVPGSSKIVFTASAHHDQTKGSLVLLDPEKGTEGSGPIVRLTPEVAFPEIEGWPLSYYSGPAPLSERLHLVAWGNEGTLAPPTSAGWDRWHSVPRPANGMGIYLFDARGALELLHRDDAISSVCPLPIRAREEPRAVPAAAEPAPAGSREGTFLLTDVYRGLSSTPRGAVKRLRIVAVPPKTHPTMNYPSIGITGDDPGKCVLGTVPVEEDGSAYFRVPAGVIVFFQALDARGMSIRTMRSAAHVQPGAVQGCAGCHEPRSEAPAASTVLAARREPSRIVPGPDGSWPLRFDRLVGPVLERRCAGCHDPKGADAKAARFDLTPLKAWESLVGHGSPSLAAIVRAGYARGYSVEGEGPAARSSVLSKLLAPERHHDVHLDPEERERLITWMDTYGQRQGSFGPDQERRLEELREESRGMLAER